MRASKKYVKAVAAIVFSIIAATLLIWMLMPHHFLTLRDRDTRALYGRYPMKEGERFSVSFKHSINLSPVIDIYQIEDGNIYVEETIYYHFGAGVQTQLNDGETLTYGEDGSMVVGNIHQLRNDVGYIVGTVYDHMLKVDDREVNLRELCGKNTPVRFNYEFMMF